MLLFYIYFHAVGKLLWNIMENYVISLHILLLLGWTVLKEIERAHLKTAGWGHWSDWRVFPGFYLLLKLDTTRSVAFVLIHIGWGCVLTIPVTHPEQLKASTKFHLNWNKKMWYNIIHNFNNLYKQQHSLCKQFGTNLALVEEFSKA